MGEALILFRAERKKDTAKEILLAASRSLGSMPKPQGLKAMRV